MAKPFGFKGGYLTELWQGISYLESESGFRRVGLSTQSTLWSDPGIFSSYSESGGNAIMYLLNEYALRLIKGMEFHDPIKLQEGIFDAVYQYGKKITQNDHLRKTFVLNSLVGLDNAAWMLYAAENGIESFDEMIPIEFRKGLSEKHGEIANTPVVSYNSTTEELTRLVESGSFFLKIKLGHPGGQREMLDKDKAWISMIHQSISNYPTEKTSSGKVQYYFDANGRYERKEILYEFVDHLQKINALEQVAIIEEPFPEHADIGVEDIPVRIVADESAHTASDVEKRIQMGYRGVALKAVAKTLSMTLKMIKVAKEKGIPCFCADLTANPILVDWNKNVAARLDPFPGLSIGLMESNGEQNYLNWNKMQSYHPLSGAEWMNTKNGVFRLDSKFYEESGGVLENSSYYMKSFDSLH